MAFSILSDFEEIKNLLGKLCEQLSGKTVLITGANGMIPSYCVEFLLYLNSTWELSPVIVIALCRNEQKFTERFHEHLANENLRCIVQDVCSPIIYNGNVDFIIHGASQASPMFYGIDPVGTLDANVSGTKNVLELAKSCRGCSVLYLSSGEVYGNTSKSIEPVPESFCGEVDPCSVRSCYAESKRLGETMCVCYSHQFGIHVSMVRLGHTYGPSMQYDGRVFCDFVRDVVSGRDIEILGDGMAERFFCYITDAVTGIFLILLKGQDKVAYNLINPGAKLKIKDLAELLSGMHPHREIKVVYKNRENSGVYIKSPWDIPKTFDISRLKSLGWNPGVSAEEGFKRTVLSLLQK